MTGAVEAEAVRRVLQYRQQARLGEWVTYWRGPPLDRLHPVAALVRGWAKHGLVEVRDVPGGDDRQECQFRRLEADFPAGWHSAPEPLAQPPSRRDPEAVGIAWMAHEAGQADERAE